MRGVRDSIAGDTSGKVSEELERACISITDELGNEMAVARYGFEAELAGKLGEELEEKLGTMIEATSDKFKSIDNDIKGLKVASRDVMKAFASMEEEWW